MAEDNDGINDAPGDLGASYGDVGMGGGYMGGRTCYYCPREKKICFTGKGASMVVLEKM